MKLLPSVSPLIEQRGHHDDPFNVSLGIAAVSSTAAETRSCEWSRALVRDTESHKRVLCLGMQ